MIECRSSNPRSRPRTHTHMYTRPHVFVNVSLCQRIADSLHEDNEDDGTEKTEGPQFCQRAIIRAAFTMMMIMSFCLAPAFYDQLIHLPSHTHTHHEDKRKEISSCMLCTHTGKFAPRSPGTRVQSDPCRVTKGPHIWHKASFVHLAPV